MVHERRLKRIGHRAVGQPCRRTDFESVNGLSQDEAGKLCLPINGDGTSTTGALAAAKFGRQVADTAAQEVKQVLTRFRERRFSIDRSA